MPRKRGPYDRIEKMVKKKRSINSMSETSTNSPSKEEDGNLLNSRMLDLYKREIPKHEESLVNRTSSISSHQQELLQEDEKSKELTKSQSIENSNISSKTGKSTGKKKSSEFCVNHSTLTFADVGGLHDILKAIRVIFYHLEDPDCDLGEPRKGFLLHGPSGCGKTHLVRAIAGEFSLPYIEVTAADLVCGISGESESKIRDMFDEALKNAPCILFIDDIESIVPKRETTERGMERRMVTQMLKCLDELRVKDPSSNVMVIGATTKPDFMDQALRRGGRFDKEFAIGMSDEETRLAILKVLCKRWKFAPDFDINWLAHHTPGYLGADLENLIREARDVRITREIEKNANVSSEVKEKDLELAIESRYKAKRKISAGEKKNIYLELQDFQIALKNIVPYSKREGFVTVPNVTWDDIGALKDKKEELKKTILWPIKYRKFYEGALNNMISKGMLLYGPKGCGKTLLAKAIANECSINFLSVKGPELLGMYVGESEKKVRECFQRARNSAPCIIFFDEFDALCPKRSGSSTNAVADRVVNQLLTEMDGMEDRKQVFVIGATNFLEKIDTAMLRPGRLEKVIYVGLPSPDDRVDILKNITKTQPKVADDVDLKIIGFDSRCEKFSGADLAYLTREAYLAAVEDQITLCETSSDYVPDTIIEIKQEHFDCAFRKVKPSVSEKELENDPVNRKFQDEIEKLNSKLTECRNENQMLKRNLQLIEKQLENDPNRKFQDEIEQLNFKLTECRKENQMLKRNLHLVEKDNG